MTIVNIVSSSLPEVVPGPQDIQADSLADFPAGFTTPRAIALRQIRFFVS